MIVVDRRQISPPINRDHGKSGLGVLRWSQTSRLGWRVIYDEARR
jgi:hypothetical protein